MNELSLIQKLSVLHCVYQLIVSADGSIDEERDHEAVTLAVEQLGLTSSAWSQAIRQNPHDCFFHVNTLSEEQKAGFKALLFEIVEMGGNREFRNTCAQHLIELCGV